jgi:MSHA biogenesis protein MshJ
MKARWQALEAKFAALQKREKAIVAAAVVFGVALIGFDVWVDPATSRVDKLQKQIAKDKQEMETAKAEVATMGARLKDLDAPNKAALAEVKSRMVEVDRELRDYERALVPPDRVQDLLRSLLLRHRGLELLSFETLPPTPLVAPALTTETKAADGKTPEAKPAPKGESIHKQGIEIKISGNYLDLLSYVSDLEHLPQKLLWGSMSLVVTTYPKSELTLTVYSLSPDSRWLVL